MSAPALTPTFQQGTTTTTGPAIVPGAGPLNGSNIGSTNRGLCSLTFEGRQFVFRTNPNEIWWSYNLITKTQPTYGGRVIQILGTRLGDLTVKVECGKGGWNYLMSTVTFLRDVLSDQRNGHTATFEYTARNWKLKVYSMTIPFEDEVTATTREMTLSFKIQEDLTDVVTQLTLNAEILRLKDGIYGPGDSPHNKYNDPAANVNPFGFDPVSPGGPSYSPSGLTNLVDINPLGDNPGGINPLFGFMPSVPGVGNLGSILGGIL